MKIKFLKTFILPLSFVPLTAMVSCNNVSSQDLDSQPKTLLPLRDTKSVFVPSSTQSKKNIIDKYKIQLLDLDHNNDGIKNIAFKGEISNQTSLREGETGISWAGDSLQLLPKDVYNGIVDIFNDLKTDKYDEPTIMSELGISLGDKRFSEREIANVILAGNQFYVEMMPLFSGTDKLVRYLRKSDVFQIEEVMTPLGVWMARVKFFDKGENAQWEHGTSSKSNYGITGYPLYMINNRFADLGVSSQNVSPRQIYEISYNHNT